MPIKCPLCQRENPDGSRFCASCGEPLPIPEEEEVDYKGVELRSEGRVKCGFCGNTADVYLGRCSYCGEPVPEGAEELSPATRADNVERELMEKLHTTIDAIVGDTAGRLNTHGQAGMESDIRGVLMEKAEELIKAKVREGGEDVNKLGREITVDIAKQAQGMVTPEGGREERAAVTEAAQTPAPSRPQQEQQASGGTARSPSTPKKTETLHIGEGATKSLDQQKECFICLGNIGPNDEYVKCDCNTYYHRECAKDVGKCPSCGKEFNL